MDKDRLTCCQAVFIRLSILGSPCLFHSLLFQWYNLPAVQRRIRKYVRPPPAVGAEAAAEPRGW